MKSKQAHSAEMKKGDGDWHVSHTSMGMGDYYGTGVRAKIGKQIRGMGYKPLTDRQKGTPPKSLA